MAFTRALVSYYTKRVAQMSILSVFLRHSLNLLPCNSHSSKPQLQPLSCLLCMFLLPSPTLSLPPQQLSKMTVENKSRQQRQAMTMSATMATLSAKQKLLQWTPPSPSPPSPIHIHIRIRSHMQTSSQEQQLASSNSQPAAKSSQCVCQTLT